MYVGYQAICIFAKDKDRGAGGAGGRAGGVKAAKSVGGVKAKKAAAAAAAGGAEAGPKSDGGFLASLAE